MRLRTFWGHNRNCLSLIQSKLECDVFLICMFKRESLAKILKRRRLARLFHNPSDEGDKKVTETKPPRLSANERPVYRVSTPIDYATQNVFNMVYGGVVSSVWIFRDLSIFSNSEFQTQCLRSRSASSVFLWLGWGLRSFGLYRRPWSLRFHHCVNYTEIDNNLLRTAGLWFCLVAIIKDLVPLPHLGGGQESNPRMSTDMAPEASYCLCV